MPALTEIGPEPLLIGSDDLSTSFTIRLHLRTMKIPTNYLTEQTTFERARSDNMCGERAFGHANDDWERLVAKMEEGDELWYFEPPDEQVFQLWGLALVRSGRVISTVITAVD